MSSEWEDGWRTSTTFIFEALCRSDGSVCKQPEQAAFQIQLLFETRQPWRCVVGYRGVSDPFGLSTWKNLRLADLEMAFRAEKKDAEQQRLIRMARSISTLGYTAFLMSMLSIHSIGIWKPRVNVVPDTLIKAMRWKESASSSGSQVG